MIARAAGLPVLRAWLHVPRIGVWHAELELEGEEENVPEGAIEIEIENATWHGTVRRAGANAGRVEVLVVGGAGGLEGELEPRYYADAPARIPLGDVLREAGETLSGDVSGDVTSPTLARWTRQRGRAGAALAELAAALGVEAWRVLVDGTVWLGAETWDEVEIEHAVIELDPAHDRIAIAVDAPTLLPGTTFLDRHVSHVLHVLVPAGIRSEVWFE